MRANLIESMRDLKRKLVGACGRCFGTGIYEGHVCECRTVQYYLNELIEAKIPAEYWELSLDSLTKVDPPDAIEVARKYIGALNRAVQRSLGIILTGKNGRGKTSIQCAIGKAAVVAGIRVQYFTAQQYVEAVKERDAELLAEYESGQLLLMDELDKVYVAQGSTFVSKTIEQFIRRMLGRGAAFVICTNMGSEQLASMFGASTMSVITGHMKLLGLRGHDFRATQQLDWDQRLEQDIDYFHPHIVELATALAAREAAEEEEMLYDWQKAT